MLDLNSDSIIFFFIFFSKEPRNNALVEKIIDKITKTKKIKAILLKDMFKLFFLFDIKTDYHILRSVNLYYFFSI